MRLLFSLLLLLPILAGPASADDSAPPEKAAVQPPQRRVTWQQHFVQANLAHDGHLTREEATAGFPLIARHFDDIDADHKSYVTENDIRSWRTIRSATRRLTHRPPDKLKPVHAFQLHPPVRPQPLPVQTASVPARVPPAPRAIRIGN